MVKNDRKSHDTEADFPEKYYSDPFGLDRYVVQERAIFEWQSPSKIDRQRSRKEHAQLVFMAVLIFALLLLFQEVFLSVVFVLLAVIYFLLLASKATFLKCQVSTLGIKIEDKYYYWADLSQFWFEEKHGTQYLFFRVIFPLVQKKKLIVFDQDLDALKTSIGTYLLYKKPQQTQVDKFIAYLKEKFPLDLDFLQLQ